MEVTGGDRYKKNGKVYSATNDKEIKKSAKNSKHIQENGAVGVDLSFPQSVSSDILEQAATETGMRYNPGGDYSDGHFHVDLGSKSKEADAYLNDDSVDKNYVPTDSDFSPQEQQEKEKESKGDSSKNNSSKGGKTSTSNNQQNSEQSSNYGGFWGFLNALENWIRNGYR